MKYAPINPSDKHYGLGVYGVKRPLPTIIGFEGSGEVVEVGENSRYGQLLG